MALSVFKLTWSFRHCRAPHARSPFKRSRVDGVQPQMMPRGRRFRQGGHDPVEITILGEKLLEFPAFAIDQMVPGPRFRG